jgi:hypothetical protein
MILDKITETIPLYINYFLRKIMEDEIGKNICG